jgi:hypothetical protein
MAQLFKPGRFILTVMGRLGLNSRIFPGLTLFLQPSKLIESEWIAQIVGKEFHS